MALYTFYPCKFDGTSESFITCELTDDGEACTRAASVLERHPSATYVAIWCGDRMVLRHHPMRADPNAGRNPPQAL